MLDVPKMERAQGVEIPNGLGTDEELLRNNAAIHLEGTGYPWEEEANVYIAGHRLGYADTGSYLAFYDIDKLQNGDEIYVTDAEGRKYTYVVFKQMVVEPTDLYVLDPIEGKNIVSLQACTLPDYSNRIIVQAELKDVAA
jgi:sortase A